MAYADLRDPLVALVEGVQDVGKVHGRERWSDTWPGFLKHFKTSVDDKDRIRGWMVSRVRKVQVPGGADRQGAVDYNNEFLIRGILGFNDADNSDADMQTLVDAIIAVLNADKNLSGATNVQKNMSGPASCRIIEPRMFGSVMCHYAEIIYDVRTQETF